MKKAAFLTAWILALAITCTFAQSGGNTSTGKKTVKRTDGTVNTGKNKSSSVTYTKKSMRGTGKADTSKTTGRASLADGTDPIGTGNNGTGGNGTGNLGNGGVGTGRPSGNNGGGTGSGVKVKP